MTEKKAPKKRGSGVKANELADIMLKNDEPRPPALMRQDLEELMRLKERELELREGLPFLHGWKWYKWAREFYESDNRLNFLCAANQISKSSTQIRKCINWATDKKLWPSLWRNQPRQFWYLYPTSAQASIEFETKWVQFLPKGEYKNDPVYGWKEVWKNKEIFAIYFNSGVTVYFKTYKQDVQALQTGTCDAIFCDEELPVELYEELLFRLSASDGYFHMVFTATLGQEYWRLVMEPAPHETELLKGALKQTVSMYDCLFYEDGTPSHWTLEKIKLVEAKCRNQNEVLKRVWGRFVMDDMGRKYETFDVKRHVRTLPGVPPGWQVYGACDIGSGGKNGHPSAIVFVAVRPDYQKGIVFLGWRGDGQPTTASDVIQKFLEMQKENKLVVTGRFYDWACKDFDTIATRMGEPFIPADKNHEKGEQILNALFKNDMLLVHDTLELRKLASELLSLRKDQPKNKAKDDLADALRYAVTRIPWDFSAITAKEKSEYAEPIEPEPLTPEQEALRARRAFFDEPRPSNSIEDEFAEWNALYG